MSNTTWTKEQNDAIFGAGGTLLVSAAAGSGKTAVLVERIINMLAREQNPIPADRILVATFSTSAAAEMRSRIRTRLSELIKLSPDPSFLKRQQILLEKANISTIHSFCHNLIKENTERLGIDSAFKIEQGNLLEKIRTTAIADIFDREYENDNTDFVSLVEYFSVRGDTELENLILSLYDFIRSFPFPLDWLDENLKMYQSDKIEKSAWFPTLFANAVSVISDCKRLLNTAIGVIREDNVMAEKYLSEFTTNLSDCDHLLSILNAQDWDKFCVAINCVEYKNLLPLTKYPDEDKKNFVQTLRKNVKEEIKKLSTTQFSINNQDFVADRDIQLPIIKKLFSCTKEFYHLVEEQKRENGIVDYTDLELLSLELLCQKTESGYEKSAISEQVSEQFDEIFLDECQDINRTQDLVFSLVSKNDENVFMVGDVKQSIYRFRKACPELFLEKRGDFAPFNDKDYPATIILSKNFRSRVQVTETVNFIFSQIMSEEIGELFYDEREQLNSAAKFPEKDGYDTELHIINRNKEINPHEFEAEYIAKTIDELLSSEFPVKDGDTLRPCEPKDFIILARTNKNLDLYEKALKVRQINASSTVSKASFESREIMILINLLSILDNPLNDIALISVLLSPMFCFSADEVAAIRLCDKDAPLYLSLVKFSQTNSHAKEFLDTITSLQKASTLGSITSLITVIFDTTDFLTVVGAMRSGAHKTANLRIFTDFARRYEEFSSAHTCTGVLSGFLRYLLSAQSNEGLSASSAISPYSDTVKIMTIHSSKGLESPICIVADCGHKFNTQAHHAKTLKHTNLGFSTKIIIPQKLMSYNSLPRIAVSLQLRKDDLSEEMRILYVALTRAKEKLIMIGSVENPEKKIASLAAGLENSNLISPHIIGKSSCYLDWLILAGIRHPNAESLHNIAKKSSLLPTDSALTVKIVESEYEEADNVSITEVLSEPSDDILSELQQNIGFEYKFQEDTISPAKLSVTQIVKNEQKKTNPERPQFLKKKGLTGAERGIILHKLMQFSDFKSAKTDLESEIIRLREKDFLADYECAALNMDKLHDFFNSELMTCMLSAKKVHREFGFFDRVPVVDIYPEKAGKSDDTILVQGIADAVIEEDDHIILVDYKTDFVKTKSELIERYKNQLILYSNILEKCFEKPVKERIIYSTHLSETIIF